MLTLTTAKDKIRKLSRFGFIFLCVIILLAIFLKIISAVKNYYYPPSPPSPTVKFGKIPQIKFPQGVNEGSFNYSVDTLSGNLPNFPTILNVYKISPTSPDLLTLKNINDTLVSLGFSEQEKVSDNYYKWTDSQGPGRVLTMNVSDKNFVMTSPVISNNSHGSSSLPTTGDAPKIATDFLDSIQASTEDLDSSKTSTSLLKITNGALVNATSLSDADFIKVILKQRDVAGHHIYYEDPGSSSMTLLIAGGDSPEVVAGNFFHQGISSSSSTYPIKTGKEALDDLKNGNAYIASFYGSSTDVKIKEVGLGYYMPNEKVNYLMPIVVFKGDQGFVAYVSAVKDESLNN